MKKKILTTILLILTTLLISIGGAVWLIPETALEVAEKFGAPVQRLEPTLSVTFGAIYQGEKADPTAKDASYNGTSLDGTWEYDTSTLYSNSTGTASDSTVTSNNTITVTFKPTQILKYKPTSIEVTAPINMVALYGSTYYTTIDQALDAANSANSGTVYSLPLGYEIDTERAKTAKTITTTTEIKSGVTLFLPYDVDDSATTDVDEFNTAVSYVVMNSAGSNSYRVSSYGNTTYLQNQIYIAENHSLSNAGTIDVAGEICGGNGGNYAQGKDYASSVTAGRHGQINLNANAKITNTGTINCYGFINESTTDNGSEVIIESGEATVVFSVGEHRGGSIYFGMIDPENAEVADAIGDAALNGIGSNVGEFTPDTLQTSPFSRFFIGSVTSKLKVKYGAVLTGHVDLYADGVNNLTEINLISTSGALITLTSSSAYVECKYYGSNHHTDLDIYGDMTLNSMSISLTVTKEKSGITVNIKITLTTGAMGSSDGIFFPICDYFDISLNAVNGSATADLTAQKIKLLPGSKLVIGQGVTVNANSIAVYKDNYFAAGLDAHYTTSTPAELTINGTLNVKNLGGKAKSSNNSAVLNIQESNTTLSQEIKSTIAGQSADIPVTFITISMGYTGIVYFSAKEATLTANGDTVSRDGAVLPTGEYNVLNGKWYSKTKVVSYNANGGSFSTAPDSKSYTVDGGYVIQESDLPTVTPTREHYVFAGWTLNGENPVGQTTYVNAELIAEWTPINYNITYNINVDNVSDVITENNITSTATNTNSSTYNADSVLTLAEPTWENFVFDGWYLDEELTKPVSILNGATILGGVTEEATATPLALYGAWYPEGTITYEITYVANNDDVTVPNSQKVLSTKLDSYVPPDLTTFDSDPTYNRYFVGWYVDENTPFDKATHLTGDITLYAKWAYKYHFILNDSQGESSAQVVEGAEAYFTPTQLGSGLNLSSYLGTIETAVSADNTTITVSTYFAGWTTSESETTNASAAITTLTASHFTTEDDDGCLTCNLYAIWADKIVVTVSVGSYVTSSTVTVSGTTVTNTTFYVTSGTSITVTATGGDGFTQTITISESYGGKSASANNNWYQDASTSITFSAAGDTTITIVGS